MTWLPSVITFLVMLVTYFSPTLQQLIANNPALTTVLAGLSAILAHILPSPLPAPTKTKEKS